MEKYEKKLKIYEIWQRIIANAVSEFYLLDTMLLVAFSALFHFDKEGSYLSWAGLFGAVIWFLANLAQLMWKRNWTGRSQRLEEMIIDKKNNVFTEEEKKLISDKDKKWDPKFFRISLHLTFILSFIPLIFFVLFGIKLNLVNLKWLSCPGVMPSIIFVIVVLILVGKLVHASYCWKPYPQGKDGKGEKK